MTHDDGEKNTLTVSHMLTHSIIDKNILCVLLLNKKKMEKKW